MVNESEPLCFAEEQGVAVLSLEKHRVTAEGKYHTDLLDTAVAFACSRTFLYVYSDIGYDGCSCRSLRALARLTGIPMIGRYRVKSHDQLVFFADNAKCKIN